jgi:DNA-binding transcriptional regulator YiaG
LKQRTNKIGLALDMYKVKQSVVSDALGVGRNTVNYWCQNVKQPTIRHVRKISRLLKLDDWEELIDWIDE